MIVIRDAIDVEKFKFNPETRARIRHELGVKDKFVIGHVGRFMKQKNHDFLIDIFAEVMKFCKENVLTIAGDGELKEQTANLYENGVRIAPKPSSPTLLLVGDGELREEMETKVKTLGIVDNVVFLGTRDDVQDLYQAMDAFLFPSLYERAWYGGD